MKKSNASKLDEICAHKRQEVERLRSLEQQLRKQALLRNDFRPFRLALQRQGEMALIAEVKKASPSAGVIAQEFNPISQAREYERGGAHALSILTDERHFGGKLVYLEEIRDQVELPLLRKDFIVEELQIYESVVAGADAILLIVAALKQEELSRFYEKARACQLDVIVEVHDLAEMERALEIEADIIGINNRNLHTFEVDLKTTEELAQEIPADCIAVSESGIRTGEDVRFVRRQGVQAILVGEALMRSDNVAASIAELLLK